MADKQKYYHLLGEVCEAMPSSVVDSTIRAGHGQEYKSASTRLHHVRQGKVASLPDLVAMVRTSMPGYEIPAHLLPIEVPAAAEAPLFRSGRAWKHAPPTTTRHLKAPETSPRPSPPGFAPRASRPQSSTHLHVARSVLAGSQGERFQFDYTWASAPVLESTCRLRVYYPCQLTPDILFTAQAVRRLKEVRLLLLGNVLYHNARLLYKPALSTALPST